MPYPLMECGHTAQGTDGTGAPVCVICLGINPGARTPAKAEPDLTGRKARCNYDNGRGHTSHNGGLVKPGPVPSSIRLPFFTHRPDKPEDSYYCGCWGWD